MHHRLMRSYQDTAFAVLGRYDILYGGHKSDAGVGVDFYIVVDFASPRPLKRVSNKTARISFVFGSTEGYGVWKDWESLG
jgi:hypothetical protein